MPLLERLGRLLTPGRDDDPPASGDPSAGADVDAGTIGSRVAIAALTWGLVWLAILVAAYLAWQIRLVLELLFLALLVAAALRYPVDFLEKRGLPRIVALLLSYLGVAAVIALIFWVVFPPLLEEASSFVDNLPDIVDRLIAWFRDTLQPIVPGDALQQAVEAMRSNVSSLLPGLQSALQVPFLVVGILANTVIVIFLSAFLLLDGRPMWKAFLGYIHPDRRARVDSIGSTIIGKLGAYVAGQLVVMAATGTGTALGMLIFGVPYVVPLGFFAFLTEALPLVGPWIGGAPVVALAFLESPLTGLLMAGWMLGVQARGRAAGPASHLGIGSSRACGGGVLI